MGSHSGDLPSLCTFWWLVSKPRVPSEVLEYGDGWSTESCYWRILLRAFSSHSEFIIEKQEAEKIAHRTL